MRLRDLCKLLNGRDWQWGKLGLALVGRALLNKALIQWSADGWGFTPFLAVVWPEVTQPWALGLDGRVNGEFQQGLHKGDLPVPSSLW